MAAPNTREQYLKRRYGITTRQYNSLLDKQEGKCALCGKPHTDAKKLHVDHNHVTLEIRGLLCAYCNHRLIGRHRDADLLMRMAAYVAQGTGWFAPPPVKKKRKRRRRR